MKLNATINAPRDRVFSFMTEFEKHPQVSKAFKSRKLLLRMSNELHSRGKVELQGRSVVEEGRYTPYPPDKILVEENFPGFGRGEGTILLQERAGATEVEVDLEFSPVGRHLRWYRSFVGKRWMKAYVKGALLRPFKDALEDPGKLQAKALVEGPTAKEARSVLFDKEAEQQAREELLRREGKRPSAGVSPSGEDRKR